MANSAHDARRKCRQLAEVADRADELDDNDGSGWEEVGNQLAETHETVQRHARGLKTLAAMQRDWERTGRLDPGKI